MATDDGRLDPPHGSDDSRGPSRPDGTLSEPELLPADWPSPVTWGAALGAGGEVLGGAADLVALASRQDSTDDAPDADRARGRRRAPRVGPRTSSRRPRPARRALRPPALEAIVVTGVLGSLAGLLLLVLFSPSGWAPASSREPVSAVSPPPRATVDLADLTVASRRIEERMREAARSRRRAAVRHEREVIRRQTHARHNAPAPAARAVTTPVVKPAPTSAPSRSNSPAVAPAVRALTPGPWNLS